MPTASDDDDWFDLSAPLDRTKSVVKPAAKPVSKPQPVAKPKAANASPTPRPSATDAKPFDGFDDNEGLEHLAQSIPPADNTFDDFDAANEGDSDPFSIPMAAEPPRRKSASIDDWLGVDDVVPDVKPAVPESEFRFPCPVCESAHYAKPSDTGKRIKCGDCTSTITVPDPPKVVPKYNPPIDNAATFELRESVHRPERKDSPFSKSAADLLRDAESTQLDEDLDKLYENPDVAGWFRDVFSVFADPSAVMQLAIVSGICSAGLIAWSMAHQAGIAVSSLVGAAAIAVCGCVLGMRYLAIMHRATVDESNQAHWPYGDDGGTMKQGMSVLVAALVASAPGQLIGSMIGDPLTLFWGVFVMLSVWGLMPIVLLAMLENKTIFGIYSPNVIKSFEQCMEPWGGMYFSSGLFFFAYFMLLAAPPYDGFIKSIITAVGLVGLAFIQARMLGKVVQAIDESKDVPQPKTR
ncbi:hypothetical protein [Rosistilla carotiformis]|nr:hypothetical protein [Rosistilla carotiformis]